LSLTGRPEEASKINALDRLHLLVRIRFGEKWHFVPLQRTAQAQPSGSNDRGFKRQRLKQFSLILPGEVLFRARESSLFCSLFYSQEQSHRV